MIPQAKWLELYEKLKEKTVCPVDLNTYFESSEIAGKELSIMNIGACDLPSGKILVRDPLVYLGNKEEEPYFQTVPSGSYNTEICVIKPNNYDCARYAAVRLCFSEERPVKFYEALIGNENIEEYNSENSVYFGFNVDAGLGCICDSVTHKLFCDWLEKWNEENPDSNEYDDYFSDLFAANYKVHPEFQREGGDWLNWKIPGTEYHIPIFQSGFGDGTYPVYFGIDKENNICQLVIQFIDIELSYEDEED